MYSSLKNIQILVALLKKFQIHHIVLSAGTRHTPLVYSVEHDEFFITYSIVDERSASFFALGLIEELREPVAICCTSGTAAANYVSAASEAFYQQLPLLILTADRNHYYMFQQEEQMIPQENLYSSVCKKMVTLPHVRDEKDFWYVSRICNEALMELRHGESGPVHINFIVENDYPIKQGIVKFKEYALPDIKKIDRLSLEDPLSKWLQKAEKLKKSKILIIYGQYAPLNKDEINVIETFSEKYNCVISTDLLSNLHTKYSLPTFAICRTLLGKEMEELCPDIVITMNANSVSEIKGRLSEFRDNFQHWHISAKGMVSDPFKCLPDIVECSPQTFFKTFSQINDTKSAGHSYYEQWKTKYQSIGDNGNLNQEKIAYSAMYATQQFLKNIPVNSLLHIANSNSIRLANYFTIDDSIKVYGNRGAHGIDGSMSSFIGQAHVSGRLSFLLIGDLSFFYDMNALWNQYIGKNIRIIVCNNSGGAIFHTYPNTTNVPTLDLHIAAEHHTSARGWAEDRGFKYLSSNNKEEFDSNLLKLLDCKSNISMLMEVFTNKEEDAESIRRIIKPYQTADGGNLTKLGRHLPEGMKDSIKKLIRR